MLWRGWLPVPTAWKGLTYGVVTLLTVGQLQFDRANPDFQIFEPVLMVLALLAAFPGERAARGQPPGPLSSGAGVPSLRESLARGHRRHCGGLLTGDLRPHGAVLSITKVQSGRPLVHAPEVRQPPLSELFLLGMRTAMTLFVVVLTTLGGKLV